MPPKVQTTKEQMLEAALQLLIREGQEAVNIKTVAAELGCSTQPLSRNFGSMETFRKELADYALRYFNRKVNNRMRGRKNPLASYMAVNEIYLQISIEEPKLFCFVRDNCRGFMFAGGAGSLLDERKTEGLRRAISEYLGIDDKQTEALMKLIIIYTRGLADMAADGSLIISQWRAIKMLREECIAHMVYAGVDEKTAGAVLE